MIYLIFSKKGLNMVRLVLHVLWVVCDTQNIVYCRAKSKGASRPISVF